MDAKGVTEGSIKEQIMKQAREYTRNSLEGINGKVPQEIIDPGLKELEKELEAISLLDYR